MNVRIVIALMISASVFLPRPAQAVTLYNVQFGNHTPEDQVYDQSTVVVTTPTPGVTGSSAADFAATETFNQVFANDQSSSTNPITGGPIRIQQEPAPRLDADIDAAEFELGYFLVELTADPGNLLNLSELSFEAQRATGGDSRRGFEVFAETNGTAFDFASSTEILDITIEPTNRSDGPTTYSLSNGNIQDLSLLPEFQGISSVAFRFYHTSQDSGGVEIGNITISGDVVAIPEPASIALFAFAGIGCLVRRR